MNRSALLITVLLASFSLASAQSTVRMQGKDLRSAARESLKKGINFFQSLAIEGGYVYHYTLDGKEKWGEGKTDDRTIEVQPPGTPAVGMSMLRAYRATGEPAFLEGAEGAANGLIKGQNELGGWDHKIYFDRPKGNKVSFDDNQTQSAISLLMALDQEIDRPELSQAVEKALKMMVLTQLDNGGWPHKYPIQGNYHDYATFNDHGINDCIRVMIEADTYYEQPTYEQSLEKVARFMLISQLPPPQPGWAQQYNEYLQPAWARSFEPPAVCPSATINNLHSLMDLYAHTGQRVYLEAIPDAIRWLKASQLPNGKWGRFLELGTNKALYYDRGRIRVDSLHQLSLERRTGYGYEVDLTGALKAVETRFLEISKDRKYQQAGISDEQLQEMVAKIISAQDDQGRWIVHNDRFREEIAVTEWNGEYRTADRISSRLFNYNVNILCEYLERTAR
ncbi:pectate lyase [Flavilitoribacter nigricans]|uniref:Pectic acid lyase n=1 Tax=Flavilitoribacter nigricans (strain ATCC 23147 / DSM 23189 / NBRC 102662 / NCIMB 1420 / SS-2) TaxID=1122177 RepID=A0A2D0NDJ7_FLAN2|nr:pectate lyase [Flavilitoribacter nigricans]PHN06259.1 hypothetical protein CRP01_11830 [Flavilitoribacter nigricans DSM 23189 = NBRC 102662]